MFYGRETELSSLRELFTKKTSSLVVCKGRRRIGKSTLIEQFGKESGLFYQFQGLAPRPEITNESQLQHFSEQMSEIFKLPAFQLRNWNEAFSLLENNLQNRKTVILFDEISWMASNDPDFAGKLKVAWDTKFKKKNGLILVLCGSVSSWIDENILNDSGFVGRVSLEIDLEELPLEVCNRFWGGKKDRISSYEKLKFLSVTGGVPRYLEEIRPHLSVEENIKSLCFKKGGFLVDEFDKIFNDIFSRRAPMYKKIVHLLASNNLNFAQICNALGKEQGGVISEYLYNLEQSGFVKRDYAWNFSGTKTKLSQYRLKDNYLRFYLKYIDPVLDKIKNNLLSATSLENLSGWNTIMGFQFENLVLQNLDLIRKKLGIDPNSIISASPYFQNKTNKNKGSCQIDLLIQTKFHTLYLCEIKYRKNIDNSVIDEVNKKIRILQRPKYLSIRPVLIYEGELSSSVLESELFDHVISFGDFLK